MNNIRYIPRFYYNSTEPKFMGVCIHNYDKVINSLLVSASQAETHVMDLAGNLDHKILGSTEVKGVICLSLYHKDAKSVDETTEPFDISLHAYDPINDIAYVAKILDIYWIRDTELITYEQKFEFIASTIINWKELV